jgi:hypothetical protein
MKYPSAPEQIPIFGIKAEPLTPVAQQIAERSTVCVRAAGPANGDTEIMKESARLRSIRVPPGDHGHFDREGRPGE